MSEQPVPDSILDLEEVEIESLAMDADEVARRLLAARGSEAPTPDEGPGQAAAGGAGADGLAVDGQAGEAVVGPAEAEAEELAEREGEDEESLDGEDEPETSESEAAGAGEQVGAAAVSVGRNGNRGTVSHARKIRAATAGGHIESCRLTAASKAAADARFLFRLVNFGRMSQREARELITVPEQIEADWRAFAEINPGDAAPLLSALRFRRLVMREFERLTYSASSIGDRSPVGGFCGAEGYSTADAGLCSGEP